MKHVVIIGGGFAGINLSLALAKNKNFHLTLIDRNNYNFFPPLLYQVATAYLEPSSISYPYRKLLRKKKNVNFRMGELLRVDTAANKVILSTGEVLYDYLVFANGTAANFFGMENIKANALPMKTINDALELRNHFLKNLETAANTTDDEERKRLLTIVIAGGGPTGVEVSGMLAEMKKNIVWKDYPELSGRGKEAHIYLVDGSDRVLAPMSSRSQDDTCKALSEMGVEIKFGLHVTDYVDDIISFSNGEKLAAKTLVWTAGVTGTTFDGVPAESYGRGNRLLVNEYNKVNLLANVFAIGDACLQTTDPHFPNGHPQLAQVAIQQGKTLAANLGALVTQKPLKAFTYFDKGTMAIIGTHKAVVDLPKPKLHFKGFTAWALWLFVHLLSLISYRNRFLTLYNWIGAYISRDQSLRMIIRPSKK